MPDVGDQYPGEQGDLHQGQRGDDIGVCGADAPVGKPRDTEPDQVLTGGGDQRGPRVPGPVLVYPSHRSGEDGLRDQQYAGHSSEVGDVGNADRRNRDEVRRGVVGEQVQHVAEPTAQHQPDAQQQSERRFRVQAQPARHAQREAGVRVEVAGNPIPDQ
ncbi:hypothetical protein GCM10023321_73150 [Pseudonocardia eucalypti]|uniref:Uncharacterized protein n=1 Tax=Pseudonocardia eucalypti TaxID=648755 RepID=A0ABP9R8Q3_9PSEU